MFVQLFLFMYSKVHEKYMKSETVSESVSTNTSTSTICESTNSQVVYLKSRRSEAYKFAKESGCKKASVSPDGTITLCQYIHYICRVKRILSI